MGMQYLPQVALEDLKAFVDGSEKAFKANFTNYEAWEKELGATGGYLTNIPENKQVKGGFQPYTTTINLVKAIEIITKLFNECVSKKTAIDITESGVTKDLELIYIKATPSILDMSNVRFPIVQAKGWAPLKTLGWNGSKATQFAKLFQTSLRNVGKYAKFQSTLVGLARAAGSAKGDERKNLNKCIKQAVHLAKARHSLITIGYRQYTALKKTI